MVWGSLGKQSPATDGVWLNDNGAGGGEKKPIFYPLEAPLMMEEWISFGVK